MKITSKEKFTEQLGKKIKYYREIRGLTLEQLANLVGCTGSYIALIEKGKNTPNSYVLYNLSRSLNVPLLFFYGIDKDKENINSDKDPILKNEDFTPFLDIAKEAFFRNVSTKELLNAVKILSKS